MPKVYPSNMKFGGGFVHQRDSFGRCQWAFVLGQLEGHGDTLNLKVIPDGPDQWIYQPNVKQGAKNGEYHFPDQCGMSANQMREDAMKAAGKAPAEVEG